jgi:uncharacterized membrane protein
MDKQSGSFLLAVLVILVLFGVVQPFFPFNVQHYSELGLLGPDGTVANFPTSLVAGHNVTLYGYVGNHEGSSEYYTLVVKLGNETTLVSNSSSAVAPMIANYSQIIGNNASYTFPMNLTISQPGQDQRLIFELWMYNVSQQQFAYSGLWNQLWLNVSAA